MLTRIQNFYINHSPLANKFPNGPLSIPANSDNYCLLDGVGIRLLFHSLVFIVVAALLFASPRFIFSLLSTLAVRSSLPRSRIRTYFSLSTSTLPKRHAYRHAYASSRVSSNLLRSLDTQSFGYAALYDRSYPQGESGVQDVLDGKRSFEFSFLR